MRDPVDVIADGLARNPHVMLTGSTERDVARALLAALRAEYRMHVDYRPARLGYVIPVPGRLEFGGEPVPSERSDG